MKNNRFPVNDIYYTIQGEGCLTGVPAVFLRLHGCPVACPFCDTKETWVLDPENEKNTLTDGLGINNLYSYQSGSEINAYITEHFRFAQWVVITGGEPAQYPLKSLVTALHDGGYKVAIETSGTECGHLDAGFDWITVSPKMNMPGGKRIQIQTLETANEIKQVVGKQADLDKLDGLLSTCTLPESVTICLQPMSQSIKATELCIETAKKKAWRLSIQVHKYLNLP